MKKAATAAVAVLLMMTVMITAFAIDIDGERKATEGYTNYVVLANGKATGNNYSQIGVSYDVDKDNYVCIAIIGTNGGNKNIAEEKMQNIGVVLSLDGYHDITLMGDELDENGTAILEPDSGNSIWSVEKAVMKVNKMGTVCFEIKLNYKANSEILTNSIQLYDEEGVASAQKTFVIDSVNSDESGEGSSSGKTTTKKTTTTKKSSGSVTTTIKKSDKDKTHRVDNVATINESKWIEKTSAKAPLILTTEAVTEASETTKEKTTKKKSKSKSSADNTTEEEVYYIYGDGVQTTIVYVLQPTETAGESEASASAFQVSDISRSSLLKVITGACALILFGVIGVWAVKSKDDESTSENNSTNAE